MDWAVKVGSTPATRLLRAIGSPLPLFRSLRGARRRCSRPWGSWRAGGGDREARITADYNAEMIEHVARFKRVRDRSTFVGDPDDVVPATFGPDVPAIRDWTEQHFDFSGYITAFQPPSDGER